MLLFWHNSTFLKLLFLSLHSNNMAICGVYLDWSALSLLNAVSFLVCCAFGCCSCWPFLKLCILIPFCHVMTLNAANMKIFRQVARMNRSFAKILLYLPETKCVIAFSVSCLALVLQCAVFFWWGVCFCLVLGFFFVLKPILLGNVCHPKWGLKLGCFSYFLYF